MRRFDRVHVTPSLSLPRIVLAAIRLATRVSTAFAIALAVACTGASSDGPTRPTEHALSNPSGAWRMVAVGDGQTCGLTRAGVLYCWGLNDRNQVGDGTTISRSAPTLVSTNLRFTSVAAGRFTSCAIAESAEAFCWGFYNDFHERPLL